MLQCFDATFDCDQLDRRAFSFKHKLMGHPALSLENLARVIPALPINQVFYSSGLLSKNDDFDRAHIEHRNGLTIEQTIENIRTSSSYIMVRSPERDASFNELHRQLTDDVTALMRERQLSGSPIDSMLYLFIASPNSITPFHIDRYSTILLQFQGAKEVTVFPPWDERVMRAQEREGFVAHAGQRPTFRPEAERLGTRFEFHPGEAVHIPFVAGHHVKNGPSDVSISMSIIFKTPETMRQIHAMSFNNICRPMLQKIGLQPQAVGHSAWRDSLKSTAYRIDRKARRTLSVDRVKPDTQVVVGG